MDSRDRLRLRLVGTGCGACGRPYRASGIRILAQREDLAFVLLHCAECGSDGLCLVTDGEVETAAVDVVSPLVADGATGYGEFTPRDEARLSGSGPVASDDVLAMHVFLAGYGGDVRSLLADAGPGTGSS